MGVSERARRTIHSSHGEKRVGKLVRRPTTVVGSLPRDLLIDVLAQVASSSFDDLFNAKLCCKDFHEAVKDDYIYQRVSIDKFPTIHWFTPSDRVLSFLTACLDKGNPESLFRQGMIEYFSLAKPESGLEYLKKASEKGHTEATYVYGMILLSQGDETCMNILNSFKHSTPRYGKIRGCRDKIKSVIKQMWINNPVSVRQVDVKCQESGHAVRVNRMGFDEAEEVSSCDFCLWSRELARFCRIINGV